MQCRTTWAKFARPVSKMSQRRGYEGRGVRDGWRNGSGVSSVSKSEIYPGDAVRSLWSLRLADVYPTEVPRGK